MADAVNILSHAETANQAPIFAPYSKVIIHAGLSPDGESEIVYTAGNDTGRTLELNNEWGTQAMANNILARIKGFQYKPFDASNAMVDPSVELGDGITVKGIYSGIFVQATRFNQLMASDVSAPVDEEIEHEYGFESQTNRAFTRMVAQTKSGIHQNAEEISVQVESIRYDAFDTENTESLASRITVNANGITQEVRDRQQAVSDEADAREQAIQDEADARDSAIGTAVTEMNSTLTQTAKQIRADVVAKRGNSQTTSFAWELLEDSFTLYSNNKQVFKANSNGITVTGSGEFSGKVSATSGAIGGFTLENGVLYTNAKTGIDTNVNGVHISSNGISLGLAGKFKVTNQGAVTATSGKIGGFDITATAIYSGMTSLSDTSHDGVFIGTGANGGIAIGRGNFKVTAAGAVSAKNLTITGGSIKIGGTANAPNFYVDTAGNLTANNGTFGGNIYAKNIKYYDGTSGSANFGTLNGAAITSQTIKGSGKGTVGQLDPLSVGGGDIAYGSISGGAAGSNYSHIKQSTLTDLNVVPNTYSGGGLSTKSLVSDIGTSLGLADLFGDATKERPTRYPSDFTAKKVSAITGFYSGSYKVQEQGEVAYDLTAHYHDLKANNNGEIEIGTPQKEKPTPFSIANTKKYKADVLASAEAITATTNTIRDYSTGYDFDLSNLLYTPPSSENSFGRINLKNVNGDVLKKLRVQFPKAVSINSMEVWRDSGWITHGGEYCITVNAKAKDSNGSELYTERSVPISIQPEVDTAQQYGRNQNVPVNVYKETDEYGEWDGKTVFVRTNWATYTGFTLR